MLTAEEKRDWIVENCRDEKGNIDLRNLDFSKVKCDVYIGGMIVNGVLYQGGQKVEGSVFQNGIKATGTIHQGSQKAGILYQDYQKVGFNLHQDHQEVGGDLYQGRQNVAGRLYGHKLEDFEEWINETNEVLRVRHLRKITAEDLEKMGYEFEEE